MSRLDLNDPIAVLLAVSRALDAQRVGHALYGGLALAVYGQARETKDADLAVAGADAAQAAAAFRAAGLETIVAFDRVRFGGNTVSRLTLLGGESASGLNTADLVEPRSSRFAAAALARAIEGTLRGDTVRVLAPEDFVLFKVLSTRELDLEDAASVLAALQERLDLPQIAREAALLASEIPDHDIAGRLAEARRRAGAG